MPAGETEVGSAGEQPARDNRLGGDGYASGGVVNNSSAYLKYIR